MTKASAKVMVVQFGRPQDLKSAELRSFWLSSYFEGDPIDWTFRLVHPSNWLERRVRI